MGFRRDGILVAVRADIVGNIGAYPSLPFGSSAEASGAAIFLPGPYRLKHYAYTTRAVTTNTCPTGVYRGVVAPLAFFATEALMDRAAHELGLDPAEIRRRNVIRPEDVPYINAVGIKLDAQTYESCLKTALSKIGYDSFRSRQPGNRLLDGKYRGIGIACVTEHTGQGASRYRKRGLTRIPGYDSALVKVEPNGRAIAWVSQATQGQGHLTAYAQLVAEQLGLRFEDVTVIEGDTAQGPYGTGTFASRGAITGGGAVIRASQQIAQKMRRIAAQLLEASDKDIELAAGEARIKGVPDMKVSLREVAAVAYSLDARELPPGDGFGLEATDYYDPPVVSITNATHIAQVAVDPVTGLVDVEKYVVVHDCGRVINPLLVSGQLHGGIVQGLGSVLSEGLRYDKEGQLLTTTLMDYLIPTMADAPDIDVFHQESWSQDTAGGFKGVGEGGVIGAVPAVSNAIRDALKSFSASASVLPLKPADLLLCMSEQSAATHITQRSN
jgi:carbon-monoxide dehydrogenase large subunit